MNKPSQIIIPEAFSRRSFLKTSTAVAGGALLGALAPERFAHAASGSDELKVALVGCGGRGSGAAAQALSTYTLGPVKLVAAADVHEDRMQKSLENLQKQHAERVDVPKERQFMGFDAYKKAIELADVVILATPPGFRPQQFEDAIKAGKHVFMEKPVASDAAGVRQVLAAAEEAKKKNLKVGVGLQRRHQAGYLETIKRLHDGEIGDITSMRAYWNGRRPWQRKRAELNKQYAEELGRELTEIEGGSQKFAAAMRLPGKLSYDLTEMEYQLRNWYYFTWLSGDHITEQHIHNLDVINWVKKGHPVKARGMGGREINNGGADDGEIFDHFAVQYEYEDGSICYSECRHQPGCWNSVSEHVQGTKGRSTISAYTITGTDEPWRYKQEGAKDPYQQEHDDLFAAIRGNKEFNEAVYGAESTMTAILGRMATYSGKELEWNKALASKIELLPENLAWDAMPKVVPGPDGLYPRAIPGVTEVV